MIERDIEETRKEMSSTVREIEERLSAGHVTARAKEIARDMFNTAASSGKKFARRMSVAAREGAVKGKNRFMQFVENDPDAVRVIGFELGVLIAATVLSLRRRYARGTEAGTPVSGQVQIMEIEEVEEKVKEAALAPEESMKKAA